MAEGLTCDGDELFHVLRRGTTARGILLPRTRVAPALEPIFITMLRAGGTAGVGPVPDLLRRGGGGAPDNKRKLETQLNPEMGSSALVREDPIGGL